MLKNLLSIAIIALLLFLPSPSPAIAQSCTPETCPNGTCIENVCVYSDYSCAGGEGIDSAIGCIPINDITLFASFVLLWSLGIGGGIATVLLLYASFMISTSAGNPRKLRAGQELIVSAIAGLIMIIFSVFLLRVIGVNILQIMTLS